MCLKLGTAPYK